MNIMKYLEPMMFPFAMAAVLMVIGYVWVGF